ncbi:uncharacterized protein DEA37_0004364 [Paragonimus westermani]|uniref:Methyltransferase TRM13 domain-containing protein n=1 Tax=Paragonimus westermani TaxID=34504 RepID=A0A5J4NSI7_9TREM|nr:uncharacterized protein DEA37_0004364 [Paragonimus westermani]
MLLSYVFIFNFIHLISLPVHRFSTEQRIVIGRLSKRLIDWSRLCYIRNELKFPNASMCTYTSHDVTLENFVLRASNAID